jgi:uncharacterized protein YggE
MRNVAVALVYTLLVHGVAAAESAVCTAAQPPQVTVAGTGVVRLIPDRVSFTVGVETEAASVMQAFKENSSKLTAVLAALKAKGVQPREIQTSNLEVAARSDEDRKRNGFSVSNLVTVTRDDPANVADLLQAAISAGANQAGRFRFFVAEPSKAQARGLELAYQDARSKAERLAALANVSLGDALRIDQTYGWGIGAQNSNFANYTYDTNSSIEVGSERVSFSVSVTYEIKPRQAP